MDASLVGYLTAVKYENHQKKSSSSTQRQDWVISYGFFSFFQRFNQGMYGVIVYPCHDLISHKTGFLFLFLKERLSTRVKNVFGKNHATQGYKQEKKKESSLISKTCF